MQTIVVTIFYVLFSTYTYAADTPATKTSYAAEKAEIEEIFQEDTLPTNIDFTIPTQGGELTYKLDLNTDEAIDFEKFNEWLGAHRKHGLASLFAILGYQNGTKIDYNAYIAKNIINTFKSQSQLNHYWAKFENHLRDPLTNCDVLSVSFHYKDENPKPIYLGDWNSARLIATLCDEHSKLYEDKQSKERNPITFPHFVGNTYYSNMFNGKNLIENNAYLALTFFEKTLAAIELAKTNENAIQEIKRNCLRRSGNIHAELHTNHKNPKNADMALQYYTEAINIGDSYAQSKYTTFLDRADGQYLLTSKHAQLYLDNLERTSRISPTRENYLKLASLCSKLGNHDKGNTYYRLAHPKRTHIPSILRQPRKRNHDADEPTSSKQPKLH